ncbi:MAG: twitch domain-containing radical SAM protein, partial [Halobacteriovoraceae bacterium]|nr:twitch domain-containing radical SAM protein [Halobacteriovoraceae bacterium]
MVDSKKMCAAPWTHLSLEPNSMLYTCCMATSSPPLGEIDPEDSKALENVWNGEKLKKIRLQMQKGEKVDQCEPCYRLEGHGDISHRLFLNERFKDVLPQLVKETKEDGFLEKQPQFFGLRFSNVCNYACRICYSGLSTGWYKDDEKLGREHPKEPIKVFKNIEQVESFFKPMINSLTWVYFAGGEPLITKEHHAFLHMLKRENKRDVHLLYNTNLSTLGEGDR